MLFCSHEHVNTHARVENQQTKTSQNQQSERNRGHLSQFICSYNNTLFDTLAVALLGFKFTIYEV